ncbi:hypothetical protein [Leisingera caerulea]|uniref:hypothetical protein n=1 Tax=Leisingera caerulea TaxID=506591 RepID=UPI000402F272|nr:hypothetical protein [Leisingera caerulea]
MSYHRYITGRLQITPALTPAALPEIQSWLQQEHVTSVLQGWEASPEAGWFDNDASWRPGMDEPFDLSSFASGIAAFTEKANQAGSVASGTITITSEGYGDADDISRIRVEKDGTVTLDGYPVGPIELQPLEIEHPEL